MLCAVKQAAEPYLFFLQTLCRTVTRQIYPNVLLYFLAVVPKSNLTNVFDRLIIFKLHKNTHKGSSLYGFFLIANRQISPVKVQTQA